MLCGLEPSRTESKGLGFRIYGFIGPKPCLCTVVLGLTVAGIRDTYSVAGGKHLFGR